MYSLEKRGRVKLGYISYDFVKINNKKKKYVIVNKQ
jgi:hypothetical protein